MPPKDILTGETVHPQTGIGKRGGIVVGTWPSGAAKYASQVMGKRKNRSYDVESKYIDGFKLNVELSTQTADKIKSKHPGAYEQIDSILGNPLSVRISSKDHSVIYYGPRGGVDGKYWGIPIKLTDNDELLISSAYEFNELELEEIPTNGGKDDK